MKRKTLELLVEIVTESNYLLREHNRQLERALKARNKDLTAAYVERDSLNAQLARYLDDMSDG